MIPVVSFAGRSSTERRALAAYDALTFGEAGPVIELLSDDVMWSERVHSRVESRVRGSDAVAARLHHLVDAQRQLPLRGVEVHSSALLFSFRQPWWDERHRLSARLTKLVSGAFLQAVTLDDSGIVEISSSIELVTATEQHLERSG